MRLHRFIGQFDLDSDKLFISEQNIRHQIVRVFRMKKGDELLLCDGNEHEARVEIESISDAEIGVKVKDRYEIKNKLTSEVTLFVSIIKSDNFELVVEKATELGVERIVPIITDRTVKKSVRVERLTVIAREAAEQCGRGTVPLVESAVSFKKAFEMSKQYEQAYFCDFGGEELSTLKNKVKSVAIFIGPEGGWSGEERGLAESAGFVKVSLGPLVFRAETAAIVGVYELVSSM